MTIDTATPNRNYPLPSAGNDLAHDVARLIAALQAVDVDVAAILTALVQKAPLLNAALSGTPTAPTPGSTDNSTRIATTQWVRANFADFIGAAPAALDTIAELAAALQNNPDIITQILTSVGLKAPLASPALTGVPTAPTAAAGTNTTQLATTAFVSALGALKANLASPAFTGAPTAPTPAGGTNSTQLATTAYLDAGRLGLVAKTITDWNTALDNGWYMGAAVANAPDANWYIGVVDAHRNDASGFCTQTVHRFDSATAANTLAWRRHRANGVWGAWYKLQISQAEQDARYALKTSVGTMAARSMTITTAAPSGGVDGDVWFQV
ncbi:pyocin knob domain-containing protein [Mesorhizobium sp. CA4]|uniref:pyocin knob domain-containing protein n=1 Tax=Mesorhizobium sp. CA4 TaxID=588499 RepID=UPI001CD07C93|nr:pyocin knob domain-containing protein [Mesorhizobium sp. CA4]MBZ9820186.1 pyocin knob domain-containing protein [Mesorhizobium sp. CA4]